MPRYRVTVEYDGTPFVGWQTQPGGNTVQDAIEAAIARFCGETVSVRGAGRTDTGVHALGQVAHFDLARQWPAGRVRDAINFHLAPAPIAIIDCAEVDPEFDARFSATQRHYFFRILVRRAGPVLDRNRVWWVRRALDGEAMHAAAQALVGQHDFTTFRASQCQAASPVRTLDSIEVTRSGAELHVRSCARSFLHNQVRSMVGSLKLVGEGRWPANRVAEVLAARDRTLCGPLAPPSGLYLVRVDYGPHCDVEPQEADDD